MAPLILLLTPRQIQLLSEFALGLSTPNIDCSNVPNMQHEGTPMSPEDFERIQQDLQNQFTNLPLNSQRITGVQGWGTGTLEGSDIEETFFPLINDRPTYERPMSVASTMDSSFTSGATSGFTEATSRTRKKSECILFTKAD